MSDKPDLTRFGHVHRRVSETQNDDEVGKCRQGRLLGVVKDDMKLVREKWSDV